MRLRDITLALALMFGIGALAYFASTPIEAGKAGVESPERLARIAAMAETWPTSPDFSDAFDPLDPATTRTAAAKEAALASLPVAADGTHDLVAGYCGACHSIGLVTQQSVSRARWAELLDWMTAKQGMPALPAEQEAKVLDYLAAHFGPSQALAASPPAAR